ncbi:hypothetical protein KDX16_30855 [Burkholderia vietnamiensis]|uniref:hypothetical protein n=1 Tax=Burkholderia vietnamiensis TaxID=60552 RepID=UPI001BA1E75B|nr:hypothetical protein [Burkholderia vietnamiensis]MBR7920200.1 hypothetical protein [Burkholderia vietnamiensis]HDR9134008.1 hypothetical protein [Burkholderia vietnamiensis]
MNFEETITVSAVWFGVFIFALTGFAVSAGLAIAGPAPILSWSSLSLVPLLLIVAVAAFGMMKRPNREFVADAR